MFFLRRASIFKKLGSAEYYSLVNSFGAPVKVGDPGIGVTYEPDEPENDKPGAGGLINGNASILSLTSISPLKLT